MNNKELNPSEIEERYNSGLTLKELAEMYNVSNSTIGRILRLNNVKLRERGGIMADMHKVCEKLKNDNFKAKDGYHYEAVSKDGKFRSVDCINSSGALSSYIKKDLGLTVPSLYDRKKYKKENGKDWFEQYFDFIEVKDEKIEVKKCPYCDWETKDIENKSGAFSVHLLKCHNKTIEDYLKEFPEDKDYFKKYKLQKEKEEFLKREGNFIICPICGQRMSLMTNSHLAKHNITPSEFKAKYGSDCFVSKATHDKLSKIAINTNKTIEHTYESKDENEIKNILIEHGIPCQKDRKVLNGTELDIYIPSLNFAIEYNGIYWHQEQFGKNKYFHLDKLRKCEEKGIKLLQIFEDEYIKHKDIVLDKIFHILHLGNDRPKIMARKTKIMKISKNDALAFLEENHIQGFCNATVYLGAIYQEKIVGVMSFIQESENYWNLTRFATLKGYICQGIGGKMFSYFIKNYNPKEIKSFADRRWTTSIDENLYTKLGFKLDKILPPDYKYYNRSVDKYTRFHKFGFRKQILHKKYGLPLTMTEREMTKELGYDRIWDCGLFKYIWKNPL